MGTQTAIEAVLNAARELGPSPASVIERHPGVVAACRAAKVKARKLIERAWREGRLQSCGSLRSPVFWTGQPSR